MSLRMKWVIAAAAWLHCGVLSAGFLNATFRADFPGLIQSPREAAKNRNMAIAAGVGGGPFGLVTAAVLTGLFYDGWTLRGDPLPCTKNPEIWCKP